MSKVLHLALIVLPFALTGCDRQHEDRTKGLSATCEVHHRQMVKTNVPIDYGLIRLNDYGRARQTASINTFPHAQKRVLGGCVVGTATQATIYVCPDCQKASQKWEVARESPK